jgi:hypothetical protein
MSGAVARSRIVWTLAALLPLGPTGCSAFRSYDLPVSVNRAAETFPAIARAADQLGYPVARFDRAVHIQIDEAIWTYFVVQDDVYTLVIQIDRKLVPEADYADRFSQARQIAARIWDLAMDLAQEHNPPHLAF